MLRVCCGACLLTVRQAGEMTCTVFMRLEVTPAAPCCYPIQLCQEAERGVSLAYQAEGPSHPAAPCGVWKRFTLDMQQAHAQPHC